MFAVLALSHIMPFLVYAPNFLAPYLQTLLVDEHTLLLVALAHHVKVHILHQGVVTAVI